MGNTITENIYKSNYNHLDEIVVCHQHCFPQSLAVKLGKSYVKKNLEWFLANENRFLFHITINNKIIGYCGSFIPQGFGDGSTSGMLQFAFKEAALGVLKKPWLLLNKEVVAFYPFIFKNIEHKIFGKKITTKPSTSYLKYLGLVVIGVDTAHRGTNVFTELMQYFESIAKQHNISVGNLSVKKNNLRAINAYKKQGWFVFKEDAQTFVMRKEISNEE
jgi:GNAT superfamily N-acetyltransferase